MAYKLYHVFSKGKFIVYIYFSQGKHLVSYLLPRPKYSVIASTKRKQILSYPLQTQTKHAIFLTSSKYTVKFLYKGKHKCHMFYTKAKAHAQAQAQAWKTIILHKDKQGSRKSKIGWELTKNGCSRFIEKKSHILVVFKIFIPISVVFMQFFWAFRPIWLAFSISGSSFWLVDTYFWSYFSWLDKSGCKNLKLAENTCPPFPSFWSPEHKLRQNSIFLTKAHK